EKDSQSLTLAIGASLGDAKGVNLFPVALRDVNKRFIERISISIVGIVLLIISILFYFKLSTELTIASRQLNTTKGEYNSLVAQLQDLKNTLIIEKLVNNRWDMGSLFKQLTYLPDKVYLTHLNFGDGSVSLSGFVAIEETDDKNAEKEARKILSPLIESLKKNSFHNVRIESVKSNLDKRVVEFTIKFQLGSQ
ncbi:MAG: PilN domain-containing protein, partial [Candidatus Omnitrophota bacterium]